MGFIHHRDELVEYIHLLTPHTIRSHHSLHTPRQRLLPCPAFTQLPIEYIPVAFVPLVTVRRSRSKPSVSPLVLIDLSKDKKTGLFHVGFVVKFSLELCLFCDGCDVFLQPSLCHTIPLFVFTRPHPTHRVHFCLFGTRAEVQRGRIFTEIDAARTVATSGCVCGCVKEGVRQDLSSFRMDRLAMERKLVVLHKRRN